MSCFYKKLSFDNTDESAFEDHRNSYDLMLVIPAYAETEIDRTLKSVIDSHDGVSLLGILVLINEGVSTNAADKEVNKSAYEKLIKEYSQYTHSFIDIFILYITDISDKWAGVGTARKLAMEQASYLANNKQTPMINLDADCIVSSNYISSIQHYFKHHSKIELATIYFEHEVEEYKIDKNIVQYECHLRYFIEMQKWLKLPYAYHTVGSSFAVRTAAYHQVGGMNRRKAGEDFYFIHKFSKKYTIGELKECTVFPSSRESTRVPFGTGRAMLEMKTQNRSQESYAPQSFIELRKLIIELKEIYNHGAEIMQNIELHQGLRKFLIDIDATTKIDKIRANTSTFYSFLKAFFQWFDAFVLMKYLHYMRDNGLPNISILEGLNQSSELLNLNHSDDLLNMLYQLRKKDKASIYDGQAAIKSVFQ